MTKLLSDERIFKIENYIVEHDEQRGGYTIAFACTIESAVLEAQGKQEPVAWYFVQNGYTHYTDCKRDWYDAIGVEEVTPLYAAPVMQAETKSAGYWRKYHAISKANNVALRKQIAELITIAEG